MRGSVTSGVELEEAELKRHKCHGGLRLRELCQKAEKNSVVFRLVHFPFDDTVNVRLTRKQILKFSFEPKIKQKYFSISALGF